MIERTEEGFASREKDTSAANDWLRENEPWEARVNAKLLLSRSYEEAAAYSRARQEALAAWSVPLRAPDPGG